MKPTKLLDAAIVAALLLAYVPDLTQDAALPANSPIALLAPAALDAPSTQDNHADGHL